MNIKRIVSENSLAIFLKMLPDSLREVWQFAKNNARRGNSKSSTRYLTDILMLTHALEKAFSLPNPRKSFGLKKATLLLDKLERYVSKYGWDESLIVPISVLRQYVIYHQRNNSMTSEMKTFEKHVDKFIDSLSNFHRNFQNAGPYDIVKENLIKSGVGNFESLSANRYAVRSFSGDPVSKEVLNKALDIAKKSPSACNRQSYRVHVFHGEQKNGLLKMQGGASSFYETVDSVLLISADSNRYYTKEFHLGYVDASLFSMTLMYAFTYLGVGSIPLTLGIKQSILKQMKKDFSIPENEIPVLLIAIGNYPEKFKVAMSHRNPIESFTTYH